MIKTNNSFDKDALIRNFSRYAHLYDRFANIQLLAANKLIKQVPYDGIRNILEIGCGTGNYTALLRKKFKSARLKALDISAKMVEIAKQKLINEKIEFITVDAEAIELKEKFSFITSNAAFQWFNNLESALARYKNALKKNGVISFSIFGPMTFWELDESLRKILDKNISIGSGNFLNQEQLKKILSEYFKAVSIKELIIKERYGSLLELLNKIKYTGTRGNGIDTSFLWSKKLLIKTEDIYKQKFGSIESTYQIFLCKADK